MVISVSLTGSISQTSSTTNNDKEQLFGMYNLQYVHDDVRKYFLWPKAIDESMNYGFDELCRSCLTDFSPT